MEKNDISFRGLNEDAVKKARGKILNSQEYIDLKKANNDEFNDVGNKIKDALDQDPPDLETVKQLKQDYPLFDDLVKQLVKNGRIEDLENEFIKNLEISLRNFLKTSKIDQKQIKTAYGILKFITK
jgi:predicted XRE-type DNA-binding protein